MFDGAHDFHTKQQLVIILLDLIKQFGNVDGRRRLIIRSLEIQIFKQRK